MRGKAKSGISESFVVGVIALVFMLVGYQTALFIHNAAIARIAANRDEPDTVYVYASSGNMDVGTSEGEEHVYVRKNSSHSLVAENVRRNLPYNKVENFRFNPNTVSVEELCRLGFSRRQAESIDNYRKKGGRFRRKTDFSKSFVVSDSIYRRLESYIDIPLVDLNLADSAALDALPGIGGWFASRILEYGRSLGGYSYKEQLMDISRFDKEKYDALSDLITVDPKNVKPYPLWSLPADSLCRHPYIGNYETARAVVLFRENNAPEMWTTEQLAKAGILSSEAAEKMSGCVIAHPDI